MGMSKHYLVHGCQLTANIEGEIVKCPIVHYAVMFGRERNQTGVLIELEESANNLYKTEEGRSKAIEEIW
jgi:hypothetical protein